MSINYLGKDLITIYNLQLLTDRQEDSNRFANKLIGNCTQFLQNRIHIKQDVCFVLIFHVNTIEAVYTIEWNLNEPPKVKLI